MNTRRYLLYGVLAWGPMPALAVLNAGLREFVVQPVLGLAVAQPLSGVTLVLLLALYAAMIFRRTLGGAVRWATWLLGVIWAALTLAFEYALIAASQDRPVNRLMEALSPAAVSDGNLFALVVLFVLAAPRLFTRPAK